MGFFCFYNNVVEIERIVKQDHGRYLQNCGKIVVGVSGGPDSLALLHILHSIVGPKKLVVAHLDHGWREDSAQEADYVRQIAHSLKLPFHGHKLTPSSTFTSLESLGREARYRFLTAVAACEESANVAVGHHADDQAETLLMHLLRGSGLRGMSGMQFERTLAGWEGFKIIRPLLSLTRQQIESYCKDKKLRPLADPTNQDERFLRNQIRHQLLPQLQDFQPDILTHLTRLSTIAAADYAFLNQIEAETWPKIVVDQGRGWLRLSINRWQKLPLSLRRTTLRMGIIQLISGEAEIGFQTIENARQGAERGYCGSRYSLPYDVQLIVEHDHLLIKTKTAVVTVDQPLVEAATPIELPKEGVVALNNGWVLRIQTIIAPNLAQIHQNKDPFEAFLGSTDKLVLRNRQLGERIQPLGMNGRSQKLKKLMIERHIPKEVRATWPIIANKGHILWLIGHHVDHRARLRGGEQQVLHLTCEKNQLEPWGEFDAA